MVYPPYIAGNRAFKHEPKAVTDSKMRGVEEATCGRLHRPPPPPRAAPPPEPLRELILWRLSWPLALAFRSCLPLAAPLLKALSRWAAAALPAPVRSAAGVPGCHRRLRPYFRNPGRRYLSPPLSGRGTGHTSVPPLRSCRPRFCGAAGCVAMFPGCLGILTAVDAAVYVDVLVYVVIHLASIPVAVAPCITPGDPDRDPGGKVIRRVGWRRGG